MGANTCYFFSAVLMMLIQISLAVDYYSLLNVERNADQAEIKRAYRK